MSLTSYIEEDLKHRIHSGADMPSRLTLGELSSHYNVSLTPIRGALDKLIEEGYLARAGKGGRLTINQDRVHSKTIPVLQPPERPGNQYEQVANDLVALSFLGREIYLREQFAASKYDISRTAMRQIFERLAGLGILEHIPRKGWKLRPFRYEYLMMFGQTRELMEVGALKLARIRLVEEDLQRIMDGNTLPTQADAPLQTDNSIHEYLILKSENLFIKDFFDRYQRYYDVLHRWEQRDRDAGVMSIHQHRMLIESLIHRSWKQAEEFLIEHIHHSQEGIRNLFDNERFHEQLFGSEFRKFITDQLEKG